MIVDVYEYFKQHPKFNKIIGSDYLFVEYKCPLDIEEFQLFTKSHLISYVVKGKKDWITPQKTHQLLAGDSLFVTKGVYTTKQYLQEDYCVMLFFIDNGFIKNFIAEYDQFQKKTSGTEKTNLLYPIYSSETYESSIQSMFNYLKQDDEIPLGLLEIKFKELLFNIILNAKNNNLLELFNTIHQNTKSGIREVMEANYLSDLKIEDFAKLCSRSLSVFKRDFEANFNTTPYRWLKAKRLDYAKLLLMKSDLNINQIGCESGFKNNSHFVKSFKEKFLLPPQQFKAKYPNGL